MRIEDIKPVGNFESVLLTLRTKVDETISMCHEKKKYNKAISNLVKLICGDFCIISVLEDGIRDKSGWDIEEMKIDLLYTHLLIIDLNDVAQLYLNNFNMPSKSKQLQDYIDGNKDLFNNLIIEQ